MKSTTRWSWLVAAALIAMVASYGSGTLAAELPAAPAVSTFAPAEDLVAQVDYYVERLESSVETEEDYTDYTGRIAKDSNTLILIAVALGLHDTANKYQAAAPALAKAAQDLAAAQDYASAKAGVGAVKAALSAQGDPPALKWAKLASMKELMEQVPLIHSRLKRNARKFESKADDIAGDSATVAVIAQGSMANSADTIKPDETQKWYEFCVQMRDAAAAVNKAAHAKDEAASEPAMEELNQSCDDCHAVFHPDDAAAPAGIAP